jgi:TIR domain-containing protein
MEEFDGAVFWSYAHEDNRSDSGNIVELAKRLAAEYSLITGEELKLFLDRDIAWGEEWRRRIDEALVETTFFVPIVTPRYFSRPECRKEVSNFHAKAQGAGLGELLMPILYTDANGFNDKNPDELIALVSKYQYTDWTLVRLEDPGSAIYRKAVHDLALRLAGVGQMISEKQVRVEVTAVDNTDGSEEIGLLELAEEINARMPPWLEAMEANWATVGQLDAVKGVYVPRLKKLRLEKAQASARFALLQRWAKEELPLVERYKAESMVYDRIRLELAPKVERAFSLLEHHPEDLDAFDPFWKGLAEAQVGIEQSRMIKETPGKEISQFWQENQHLSKLIRQVALISHQGEVRVQECNEAVERWIARQREIQELRWTREK